MKYSISQKLKNVLKNRIKILINPILHETVDFMIDNLLIENSCNNKYLSLISNVQSSIREIVRNVVITTFQEIDNDFKESAYRKSRYYINKSNVDITNLSNFK